MVRNTNNKFDNTYYHHFDYPRNRIRPSIYLLKHPEINIKLASSFYLIIHLTYN